MLGELGSVDGTTTLQYGIGQGDPGLRERICEIMTLSGIDVTNGASPDDVVVTVGGQQALDLIARVFLDPGDVVLAEGPSYVGALGVFQAAEADVVHVAMDGDGIVPAALEAAIAAVATAGKRAKFLYTVPAYQNPAGVTLTDQRRDQILAICERAGLLVVEDDPYGLLGFDSDPLPALRSRSRDDVIYVSTFSKTFAPGLRVGWILAPHAVREKLVIASEAQILCPSAFAQAAVSAYIETMPWQQQLKTFRETYRERRDAALSAAHRPDARWHHLDRAGRRLLHLGHPPDRSAQQGDAAAGDRRTSRVRSRHGLLRRRERRRAPAAELLLPAAGPDPRGRPPAQHRRSSRKSPCVPHSASRDGHGRHACSGSRRRTVVRAGGLAALGSPDPRRSARRRRRRRHARRGRQPAPGDRRRGTRRHHHRAARQRR